MAFFGVAHVTEWAKIRFIFHNIAKNSSFCTSFHGVSFARGDAQSGGSRGGRNPPAPPGQPSPRSPSPTATPRSLGKSGAVQGVRRETNRHGTQTRSASHGKYSFWSPNRWFLMKKREEQSHCEPAWDPAPLASPPSHSPATRL